MMPLLQFPTRKLTLASLIRILRLALIVLAAINLCALAAAFQLYLPTSVYNFQDTAQLAVNTFLFLAGLYSFLGNARWSRRIRATAGLILIGCNAALVGVQFKNMALYGGCDRGKIFNIPTGGGRGAGAAAGSEGSSSQTVSPMKRRCHIQMVIGIVGVLWSVFLAMELVLTNIQRKRELDQKVRMHRIAYQEHLRQQQQSSTVHLYQPDLSIRGELGPGVETAVAGHGQTGESMELESLPAYEPRPTGPQPQIVDMANMGHTARRTAPPEMIQSPPPSYQSPHY